MTTARTSSEASPQDLGAHRISGILVPVPTLGVDQTYAEGFRELAGRPQLPAIVVCSADRQPAGVVDRSSMFGFQSALSPADNRGCIPLSAIMAPPRAIVDATEEIARVQTRLVGGPGTTSSLLIALKDGAVAGVCSEADVLRARLRISESVNERLATALADTEGALHAKTQFYLGLARDLRAPLASISSISDLIRKGLAGPQIERIREYAADIHTNGSHLQAFLSDLLDLEQIESGTLPCDPEIIDIAPFIAGVVEALRPRARAAKIHLVGTVEEGLPVLRVDPRHLRRILVALIEESIRNTLEEGHIAVNCLRDLSGGLVIDIRDTSQDTVTAPLTPAQFFSAGRNAAITAASPALRLALAAGLAKLNSGSLAIASESRNGALSTLWFPPFLFTQAPPPDQAR